MLRLRLVSGWMALAILGCGGVALIRVVAQNGSDGLRSPQVANPRSSPVLPRESPTEKDFPNLHNLFQVSDRIYSGAEPHGEEAFSSLVKLGVKTIVSVDGAEPNVAEATKHGLRYMHIPIGYSGLSREATLSLTRLVREAEGPFYVHCHHGRHRAPAAAAVACIADGQADGAGALKILERAGTSTNYAGLWRDVAAFVPPGPDVELPELVAMAKVDSLVAAMALVDRAYDNLKLCRDAGWKTPPGHPDLVPSQEALLLKEALRETARNQTTDQEERFARWMRESESLAGKLEAELASGRFVQASAVLEQLNHSCAQCHRTYRN